MDPRQDVGRLDDVRRADLDDSFRAHYEGRHASAVLEGDVDQLGPGREVPWPAAAEAAFGAAFQSAAASGCLVIWIAPSDTANTQAACGRRAVKAAASGRHAPATRPGALRDLVEEHLRRFPDTAFTPHQVGRVLTRSAGAVANALDKLTGLGTAQMVTDKPRTYRLAPAPDRDAAGEPGTSAETATSAA